jgi:murein DD-endopeptidase MepM/ murein hydrolase activator NlpD
MIYKNILYSNSKLLTLYFIGTFIGLLLITFLQQSWYKISESEFFEKYFIEQVESETDIDTDITDDDVVASGAKIPGIAKNEFIIDNGDTLASIFTEAGIDKEDINKIIASISKIYNPKKLRIGNTIHLDFSSNNEVLPTIANKIVIRVATNEEIEISKIGDNYKAVINNVPLIRHIAHLSIKINNSFIASASKLSIPYHSIMTMVKAYSYDVDFQRDLKSGNKLDILVDKYYTKEGKFSHIGGVLYSSLALGDRKVEIFQYQDKNGDLHYFNEDAVSVIKQLLKTPINAARISSGFGMRKHPVLGYSRMHKGMDFAAPIGTPILAAGSGVIELIGRKGGLGKYIQIKHSDTYSTAYGHMKSFAKGMKKGSVVRQGEVIGYVGVTGITSGPHLHYEVLKYNKQINPAKLKFASEVKLAGAELKKFKDTKKKIADLLKKISPQSEAAG